MPFAVSGEKIFTSANKLYTLSKYHPVGIMVFGSAAFMDVPWETIIKIYRNKLGKTKFKTLKKHCDDFISFSGNVVWSSSGIYYDSLVNYSGNDSILKVDLTITNSTAAINFDKIL